MPSSPNQSERSDTEKAQAEKPALFNYPENLPICEYRTEILELLKKNRVIIVSGETGSGKTTQLPKMAMEFQRGKKDIRIACTQPRRVAATSVAERVAKELGCSVGETVGYQHRFEKKLSDSTRIKFMTDGILLTETLHDPLLKAYDTIIIDEAHERTLNIDFLLGIVKRISEKRSDLKIIISSATLDTEEFARFFDAAPVISVPGRLYPVETVYMPCEGENETDLPRDVAKAARTVNPDDDILVFLPGERDIRETLDRLKRDTDLRRSEIIPLFSSLPPGELMRAFRPASSRKIILATNVAETSLTIPGIKAVIDSGLARISRYVHRTHVQRLQIEPISKASARQRAGRSGRIAPGKCIRLYSEADFLQREDYTQPEILRSSLAGVILTMLELRLGNIENFPFIDPPKPAMIREGLRELLELGAICRDEKSQKIRLTGIGRRLAKIPLEPRLSRMIIAASELATLPSALPVIAAMSCDDPRKRPMDEKEKADAAHAKWKVRSSDFLGTLELWKWWERESSSSSATSLRKLATRSYLSYPKMREWRELVYRLETLAKRLGLDTVNDNGGPDALHRALLVSLLGRIGKIDEETREYKGAHGIRFAIHPSSALAKRRNGSGEWIMAGELVDTSRLFARNAAFIDPLWIEPAAGNLCRRSYYQPEWDEKSGFARTKERVSLYGLVIADGRRRDLSRIDPPLARSMMILHALVLGEFPSPPQAVRKNAAVIADLKRLSERLRTREIYDTDRLAAFFEKAIPPEIITLRELGKWLHGADEKELKAFLINRAEWIGNVPTSANGFPETITVAGTRLHLKYRHSPEDPDNDGITCTVKKSDAPALLLWRHDWLVPGALAEKVGAIINSLPSATRRALPPISETLAIIMPLLKGSSCALSDALSVTLEKRFGVRVSADAIESIKLPEHLKIRFTIRDNDSGKTLSSSRDLKTALADAGIGEPKSGFAGAEKNEKHTIWDFGKIESHTPFYGNTPGKMNIQLYKGLHDEGDGVSVRFFKTEEGAATSHAGGVSRLIFLELTKHSQKTFRTKDLSFTAQVYLKNLGYAPDRIADDLMLKAIRTAAVENLPRISTVEEFAERIRAKRSEIATRLSTLTSIFREIMEAASASAALAEAASLPDDISEDISTQSAWLVFPGFVASVPHAKLEQYPRYFNAIKKRIERARIDKTKDRAKQARFEPYWQQYKQYATSRMKDIKDRAAFARYRWILEEYRISLFAQEIKTLERVSPEILSRLWLEAVK
ncbi:MAG: ATP-dependent RNA helicase HrpA [Kiritimatiellae bacterium]|nr:ATP-dependent RNA helicase HrpA [Kiritimatiellia bacterium]